MRGIGQNFTRFADRAHGEEFEQHWQVVWQFRGFRLKACGPVVLNQINHRAAPVTAFAVNMLKQVEAKGARAVKQRHIGFLQVVDIASGDVFNQLGHGADLVGLQQVSLLQRFNQLGFGCLQIRCRIA